MGLVDKLETKERNTENEDKVKKEIERLNYNDRLGLRENGRF